MQFHIFEENETRIVQKSKLLLSLINSIPDYKAFYYDRDCRVEQLLENYKNGDNIIFCDNHSLMSEFKNRNLQFIYINNGHCLDTAFHIFDSYASLNYYCGNNKISQASWYTVVIPSFYQFEDLDFNSRKLEQYCLFFYQPSGLDLVLHLAKTIGFYLVIAISESEKKGLRVKIDNLPCNIELVQYKDKDEYLNLFTKARVLLQPSTNLVEDQYFSQYHLLIAMGHGIPIVSSDWGFYVEFVQHGLTGYRCRTLEQFEYAIENSRYLDSEFIYQYAIKNYGFESAKKKYGEYFDMLNKVKHNRGFMLQHYQRDGEFDWLTIQYPIQNGKLKSEVRKKRILIITEAKYAFGRIFHNIQKYSRHHVDIWDWSNGFPPVEKIKQYSVIYPTCWDISKRFQDTFSTIIFNYNITVLFTGHGKIDYLKQNFDQSVRQINNQIIDGFNLQPELVEWIKRQKRTSVVSRELYHLLNSQYDIENVYLTECGAEPNDFYPTVNKRDSLTVLIGFCRDYHRCIESIYNAKRKPLVSRLEQFCLENQIRFLYPEPNNNIATMRTFYQQGDVFLCVSHSEGNPLGAFEAGACRLTVISTTVGAMTDLINNDVNGYLVDNSKTDDDIYNEVCDKLLYLKSNREKLEELKTNMYQTIINGWKWEDKISQWDDFFDV